VDTGTLSSAKRPNKYTPIATSTPGPVTARAFFIRGQSHYNNSPQPDPWRHPPPGVSQLGFT
jgi:hypothetical protein